MVKGLLPSPECVDAGDYWRTGYQSVVPGYLCDLCVVCAFALGGVSKVQVLQHNYLADGMAGGESIEAYVDVLELDMVAHELVHRQHAATIQIDVARNIA